MKILYGITKGNFGGAQRYVFDLAREAKKAKHDVAVLCGEGGVLVDKLKSEKIRVIEISTLNRDISLLSDIKSFFTIYKRLREEKPDVFHTNSSKMGGLGNLAARLARVHKIIFTGHGWAFNESRPMWQKMMIKLSIWFTICLSHQTICVSKRIKNDVEQWPFIKNRLIVIHNGISSFNLDKRKDKSFTVGTIAELHRIKGLDILLRAWSHFRKKREGKLLIIGEGEERQNLQNMAKKLDISDSVVFKGQIDNARLLLSTFDIFCIPSRSEGLPYTLLEAGLAGLSVIATAVGGIPEVIESGLNGVLVPVEDSESLFSTLVLLAEDQKLRERLGQELKKTVEENFSLEQMSYDTLKQYG